MPPNPFSRKTLLFLVATPIGNLKDLSERAIDTLKKVDAVLSEDTRRTRHLLEHFGIQKPLISYHKFKEKKELERIIKDLKGGKHLALVSDAGTPCINDPERILVEACFEEGIEVDAIPGPCSVIQALVLSGFPVERFQFIGFLPKNPEKTLRKIFAYPGTTVAFESPERLLKTLSMIPKEQTLAILREMTKIFQERRVDTARKLFSHFKKTSPEAKSFSFFLLGDLWTTLQLRKSSKCLENFMASV